MGFNGFISKNHFKKIERQLFSTYVRCTKGYDQKVRVRPNSLLIKQCQPLEILSFVTALDFAYKSSIIFVSNLLSHFFLESFPEKIATLQNKVFRMKRLICTSVTNFVKLLNRFTKTELKSHLSHYFIPLYAVNSVFTSKCFAIALLPSCRTN